VSTYTARVRNYSTLTPGTIGSIVGLTLVHLHWLHSHQTLPSNQCGIQSLRIPLWIAQSTQILTNIKTTSGVK